MPKAIAFELKDRPWNYVSDGPDMEEEDGCTTKLEDALLVFNSDNLEEVPTHRDIESFYKFMRMLSFFDLEGFQRDTQQAIVDISEQQLAIVRERNEW